MRTQPKASRVPINPVREIAYHKCQLNVSVTNIYNEIKDGFFVKQRRKLRQFLTVCPDHPRTIPLLRSSFQVDVEIRRHISDFATTIHPLSRGRLWWDCVMFFVYILLMVINAFEINLSADLDLFHGSNYLKYVLDFVCFLDIIINFFTGYYDKQHSRFVLSRKHIAIHYIRTYFFPDWISSFPVDFFIWCVGDRKKWNWLKVVMFLKLVRYSTVKKYFAHYAKFFNISETVQSLFKFSFILVLIMLYTTSIMVAVVQFSDEMVFKEVLKSESHFLFVLQMTQYMIFIISGSEQDLFITKDTSLLVADLLWIFLGAAINIFLLAKLMDIYWRYTQKTHKRRLLRQEINHYMHYKGVSPLIKEKMKRLLRFKFQNALVKEDWVLNQLSGPLQKEIILHNCKSFIERVDFFRDFSTDVMMCIADSLRMETYITNDVIFQAGVSGSSMYFIYSGRVAVFTKESKEICHLEEGNHFGEIALLVHIPRIASVVAITECELYRLQRKDFLEAIAPYPHLYKRLQKQAVERLRETQSLYGEDAKLSASISSILRNFDF